MPPGKLIVLEGIDGSGTTTQARLLCEWLAGRGVAVHLTREPSDGPVGRLIREILHGAHAPVAGDTMALLFAADRVDHLSREVLPALDRGTHVVTDRYYHSSLAYQAIDEAYALAPAEKQQRLTEAQQRIDQAAMCSDKLHTAWLCGLLAEAKDDWAEAERLHRQATRDFPHSPNPAVALTRQLSPPPCSVPK